jgi:hypothetical protein
LRAYFAQRAPVQGFASAQLTHLALGASSGSHAS